MKIEEIVHGLVRCGLADKEARAFVHLADLGKSKVTDLAKRAGLKRAETYQILERLQGRGLVEGTLERPRLFTAVEPARALEILLEERAQELKAVERERQDIVESLQKLGGAAPAGASGSFRILHDQNQIRGQLARSIAAAKREVVVVTSGRGLGKMVLDGLDDALRAASARGVEVRLLTEIQPGQEDGARAIGAFATVRHLMVPRPLRFVIVDDAEILQYVTADPPTGQSAPQGSKETAFWIGASDHVQAQRAFFDELWNGGVDAGARFEEIASGRAAEQVAVVKGRFTRYEKQKEMALRASESLVAVLSAGDAERFEKSGLKRLFASLAKRGVAVRVLAPTLVAAPGVEAARLPERAVLPPFQVVDGREMLLAFSARGAGDSLTEPGEFGVHVAIETGARAYQGLFDELWGAARAEDKAG